MNTDLGCFLLLQHVDGHVPHDSFIRKYYFKASDGLRHATIFTLRKEGVPSLRGHGRGDMVVELQVQTPTNLCEEQKKVLRDFDTLCQKHGQHAEEEGFFKKLFNEVLGKN